MFIQTESTPNPATLKFLPGRIVLEVGTADFPNVEAVGNSPLASRIFDVEGVSGVFFGIDFITVTKLDDIEWDHIKSVILNALMAHYQSGDPVMTGEQAGSGHAEHTGEDTEIVTQIKELLDITFHGFEGGVVYLHMQGACAGCPSSTLTLKSGIEKLLRHYIPDVVEVRSTAA